MTINRSSSSTTNNLRTRHMISLQLNTTNNPRFTNHTPNHISMMTRYYPRRNFPRTSYSPSTKRLTIWYNLIHHIRSIFLYRIFLSLLPFKPSPYPRTRRMLTTYRNHTTKPIRSSPIKYSSIISLRSNNYLSPS